MEDTAFDRALIRSALDLAAMDGWSSVTVAGACRSAGLDLARARARFPMRAAILARFSQMADQTALRDVAADGSARDRLFDMLMRRIDAHQEHRDGVVAVLDAARTDPGLGVFLAMTAGSGMRWMLEGAGIEATGLRGTLRLHGLVAVWLMTLRTWRDDSSEDLSQTMAALDEALNKADRAEAWLGGRSAPAPASDDVSAFDAPLDATAEPPLASAFEPPLAATDPFPTEDLTVPPPLSLDDEPGLDEPSGLRPSPGAPPAPPDVPANPVG